MTREAATHQDAPEDGGRLFVGVDVGNGIIRAGVFSESLRRLGKTKVSTKVERGAEAVIARIATCIRYAADECNLPMEQIHGVGIGVPGTVEGEKGQFAPDLAWTDIPLQAELERLLSMPVSVENIHNLATLGIYSHEAHSTPRRFAALFLGPQIGGGLIVEGRMKTFSNAPGGCKAPVQNILHTFEREEFAHFRSRDFRKALRKDNPAVHHFLQEIAVRIGQITAELVSTHAPDVIALGGGVMDEMKEEVLQIVEQTAGKILGTKLTDRTTLLASTLGDLAGITGAAVFALQREQPELSFSRLLAVS